MNAKMKIGITSVLIFALLCGCLAEGEGPKRERSKRGSILPFLSSSSEILSELIDIWHFFLRNPDLSLKSGIFRSKEHEIIGRITAGTKHLTLNTFWKENFSKLEIVFQKISDIKTKIYEKKKKEMGGRLEYNPMKNIFMMLNNLSRNISEIGQKMDGLYNNVIYEMRTALPSTVRLELQLDHFFDIIQQIEISQRDLQDYLKMTEFNKIFEGDQTFETKQGTRPEDEDELDNEINSYGATPSLRTKRDVKAEKFTLLNFATWATGHGSDSIKTLLSRLHAFIVPQTNLRNGLLDMYSSSNLDLTSSICNLKESPHQVLYNLYNTAVLADFKGYAMLQFSYIFLRLNDKGNFTYEAKRETEKFEQRSHEKADAIRNALTNADRSLYNCDPKQYIEGLNYVRLTNLLQGYIENEVNLNPYGTCGENCPYYYYTEYHGCYKEQFCSKQRRCRGKVVECKYIDSDMTICKSSNPERRYDWIEYENSRVLGNKGRCQTRNLFKVDSWWRYLFWHCSYCFCLCDEGNNTSDRYFNLREVTSDTDSNKVITGVRIIKHNGIIHLQIQQGVLLPRGLVDKSTLSWKPVDNYTIQDAGVESGIDYHTMSWMDRTLDIDEAFGPDEHVLTGIRFRKLGHHLNLEIRTTPINFTTGEVLSKSLSLWQGNDNTEVSAMTPRKEILLINPDIPIRNGPHTVNSKHNQYIKFQATSADSDASQTTVPYLDSQPLKTQGFPLSGIGFIYREKPNSGGFIAPKLISYNFKPHI